ncbi:phosphoribosylamine--glycine ligase [Enterovirga aerilata]|uniref:Glycinamide ribonucleotide synthetase n=1 Tax=Enterovirga aerilata TaxID=2730920 RepID=A0A849I5Z4_9HYPH|nr:phosphoribosylamine--glycine ligase [Enterovirga sp. DB1703]NNM71520.1 phosphoribosylamine--glycine ligase [Enterovirga sp. DB1703]
MRFLGIGDTCDLGALYGRLAEDGHEVRVFIGEPLAHGTMAGIVARTGDWQAELDWIREAGPDGIVLFENVAKGRGAVQDELRGQGFNVIGGSGFGDRLEKDRAFAQAVLAGIGLRVAGVWEFDAAAPALAFLAERPARYVLKFSGEGFGASDNYVGRLSDGRDVAAMLRARLRGREDPARFILMEHLDGVEMGVGAYFDGERFLEPACLDWEHKRFFPGDMGELTGEMGTVVTYERTGTFFARTLARMAPLLRENRYLGYINLNTIVNERGIWPLEFTCRFGYPGFAILDPLQETAWAELFRTMTSRSGARLRTRPGFAVGVVLTTPPFPYTRREIPDAPVGLPVLFEGELGAADRANFHHGEVGLDGAGALVTSGIYGWTAVVTGTGATIAAARDEAYALADRVLVPDLRYRRDIGERLQARELARVEGLGLLDPPAS